MTPVSVRRLIDAGAHIEQRERWTASPLEDQLRKRAVFALLAFDSTPDSLPPITVKLTLLVRYRYTFSAARTSAGHSGGRSRSFSAVSLLCVLLAVILIHSATSVDLSDAALDEWNLRGGKLAPPPMKPSPTPVTAFICYLKLMKINTRTHQVIYQRRSTSAKDLAAAVRPLDSMLNECWCLLKF